MIIKTQLSFVKYKDNLFIIYINLYIFRINCKIYGKLWKSGVYNEGKSNKTLTVDKKRNKSVNLKRYYQLIQT